MKPPTIVSEIEAIKKFELAKLLQRYCSSSYVSPDKAGSVRVYEGNLEVEGHLWLNYEKGWNEIGMIVTGDLIVSENILNSNINSGPFLVVLGNVKAKNLLSGGGEIYIAGNADIVETCIGEYNDGVLVIKGTLKAQLLIVDDHHTDIGSHKCPSWDRDEPPEIDKFKLSDLLVDEIEIQVETDPYDYEFVEVLEEIVPRLEQGLPILRDKKSKRKEKGVEYWLAEVTKSPNRFDVVPKKMRTPEMCMIGLNYYGGWLEHVPDSSKTREVCLTAVGNRGNALQFVPEKLKDEEMCKLALESSGAALRFVPQQLRTKNICMTAVSKDGNALAEVNEELRTEDVCMTAVKQNGDALACVPLELRTRELCLEAMRHLDYGSVEDVPAELLDEELCVAAVQAHGGAFEEIPEEFRTAAVCLEAVKKDGSMIEYVPEEVLNDEICLAAVTRSPETVYALERLGKLTEELCLVAVTKFGSMLQYVPRHLRTERVCVAAVKDMDDAMTYVPDNLQDNVKKACAIKTL